MTRYFPVDQRDVEQLLKIRRYLIGYRITNGWTQMDLSMKINGTKGMVWDLESNTTWQWRFMRLQQWPMPFGLRLDAVLFFKDTDLDDHVHAHPEVAPLFDLAVRSGDCWATWQRAYLGAALSAARRLKLISPKEMGRRLGVSADAVTYWEKSNDEMMLPKMLHYARTLDGHVELSLSEVQ